MFFSGKSKKITPISLSAIIFLLMAFSGNAEPNVQSPVFVTKSDTTDSGFIKIEWELREKKKPEGYIFIIEKSKGPDFKDAEVLYKGPDMASYVSGLPNGVFYYRVKTVKEGVESVWSEPLIVHVKHHSLKTAFLLSGIGAVVFLVTAGMVIFNSSKKETNT